MKIIFMKIIVFFLISEISVLDSTKYYSHYMIENNSLLNHYADHRDIIKRDCLAST